MHQRKDGRWEDTLTINGKRKHFYGVTKSEVKRKIAAYTEEAEKGKPFRVIADEWDTAHRLQVTPNAHGTYLAPLRRAVDFFGDTPASEITAAQVSAFIRKMADQGFSRRSVQLHRDMLNMIFNHCIAQPGSSIKYNPVSAVKLPKGLPASRREPPQDEQLINIVPTADDPMSLFAWFLLYTGLRRAELLALRWEDIDREDALIHIRREVVYESNQPIVVDRAKTPAGVRDVDLLDKLAAVLPEDGHGYIFGGDKPLSKTQFRKEWGKYCTSIGQGEQVKEKKTKADGSTYWNVDYKAYMTPHQFRHAYASMLDDAGIDEMAAKTMLGHKSIVTTKDVYTHIRKQKRERAAAALNQYLSQEK